MRHETCLVCLHPEPGTPIEGRLTLQLAESVGDHVHHHHRIKCVNCGAWWFDDLIRTGSHTVVLDQRDTSWCSCPEDAEYYQRGATMVMTPERECRCTKAVIDSMPELSL